MASSWLNAEARGSPGTAGLYPRAPLFDGFNNYLPIRPNLTHPGLEQVSVSPSSFIVGSKSHVDGTQAPTGCPGHAGLGDIGWMGARITFLQRQIQAVDPSQELGAGEQIRTQVFYTLQISCLTH